MSVAPAKALVLGHRIAPWPRLGVPQIILLGAMTAVGPFTIDLYLPAFPDMAADLATSEAAIQLSLTAVFIGIAVGNLVVGPIADRVGRRLPLLVGFAGYSVTSVVIATATIMPVLLGARFVQGLFAAAGMVTSRAILRDHVSGPALARTMAGLMLVMGVVPILAPPLGSLLVGVTGWRGLFVLLTAIGAVLLVLITMRLPESLPPSQRRPMSAGRLVRTYGDLLLDRSFIAPSLVSAFGFAALFAWISDGSFLLQGPDYGLSEIGYGLVFALASAFVIGGSQIGTRVFLPALGEMRTLRGTASFALAACVTLVAFSVVLQPVPIALLVALVMVVCFAAGILLPVGSTVALSGQAPSRAGQASGLLGVLQFTAGAVAAPLAGVLGTDGPFGMAIVMTAGMALSVALALATRPIAPDAHPVGPGAPQTEPVAGQPIPAGG